MVTEELNMTEDEWFAKFKPKVVPTGFPQGGWGTEEGSILFETFGDSLVEVNKTGPLHVWTLIDGDEGGQYIVSGMHFVNRIGYFITEVPYEENKFYEIEVDNE